MKKIMLLFILLFTFVGAFAQETADAVAELEPSFNALLNFFLPAVSGVVIGLFSDTVKHIKAGTWDPGIFAATKLKPLLLTLAVAIVIYYILIYVPFLTPYLEILAEKELAEVTSFFLIGYAGTIIDGFTKKKKAVVQE